MKSEPFEVDSTCLNPCFLMSSLSPFQVVIMITRYRNVTCTFYDRWPEIWFTLAFRLLACEIISNDFFCISVPTCNG